MAERQAGIASRDANHSRNTRAFVTRSKNALTDRRPFSLLHFWHDRSQFDSSSAPPSTSGDSVLNHQLFKKGMGTELHTARGRRGASRR